MDEKSDLYLETDVDNKAIRFSSHGSVSGSLQQSGTFIREFAANRSEEVLTSGFNSSGFLLDTIYGSGSYVSGFALNRSEEVLTSGFNNSGFLLQTIYASGAYLASSASNTFNKVTASGKSLAGAGALSTLDTCEADSTSDTLILTSGDNNAIYLFANPTEDSIMVSGAHRFWVTDGTTSSGVIGHNDSLKFIGGTSINTTVADNVVTIDWAGDPAYTTDLELMAVSGYFSKASGNLESHMLSSSGYFHKASGNLMGYTEDYTRAASGWNTEYTNAASGWNTEYTSAASGWATYEGISGIDLHNGTGGATRKFGIANGWLTKAGNVGTLTETVNIGHRAGLNAAAPNLLNLSAGANAGAQDSNLQAMHSTTNLGAYAGAKLEGGQGQIASVHIGYLAGYTEEQSLLPAGFETTQTNVFIGHKAGWNNAGTKNMSIGTFNGSVGSDAINNDNYRDSQGAARITDGHMLNIANSIAGKMDSATTGKRFVIGKVETSTSFDHTLKLVPAGSMAATSTFHIARNTSQAGNMMTTEVSSATFFVEEGTNNSTSTVVSDTRTDNYLVNKNGYLTIPMFFRRSDLPSASENPGMIAMYRTNGDYNANSTREGHFLVYSDGSYWRAAGTEQKTDLPS